MCWFGKLRRVEWLVKIMIYERNYCWVHDLPSSMTLLPGQNFCNNFLFWTPFLVHFDKNLETPILRHVPKWLIIKNIVCYKDGITQNHTKISKTSKTNNCWIPRTHNMIECFVLSESVERMTSNIDKDVLMNSKTNIDCCYVWLYMLKILFNVRIRLEFEFHSIYPRQYSATHQIGFKNPIIFLFCKSLCDSKRFPCF
jgi:hypothetical protein